MEMIIGGALGIFLALSGLHKCDQMIEQTKRQTTCFIFSNGTKHQCRELIRNSNVIMMCVDGEYRAVTNYKTCSK